MPLAWFHLWHYKVPMPKHSPPSTHHLRIGRGAADLLRKIAAKREWTLKVAANAAIRRYAEELGIDAAPPVQGRPSRSRRAAAASTSTAEASYV